MHPSLTVLLVLASAVFVSWLATFSFECYYRGPVVANSVRPKDHEAPYPGATLENIFWFLQISDIHLSVINKLEVKDDFRSFCTGTVSTISPSLILATGDLTHAKFADERSSQQFEEEWKAYSDVLRETKVEEERPWLDIRGNHDTFDVESLAHENNMYLRYSGESAGHDLYSYSYTHSTGYGSYKFIGMDACLSLGPRRPFNFFGVLHDEDLTVLRSLASSSSPSAATAPTTPNSTLWFSHFPTSTIVADHRALRQLMSTSVAHICGHLHDLNGHADTMYARHPSGHLELELVDFKDHRMYRLMAYDHDLFSFTDTHLHRWPLVLVTNPKDARFSVPGREPLGRMAHSTHVRILAFSPSGIKLVRVWLDGRPLPPTTRVQNGPLYTTPWDPALYSTGLHTITVVAEDGDGGHHNSSHQFSLDGSLSPLDRLPQLMLLTNAASFFQMFFIFLWLTLLAVLALSWINRAGPVFLQPLVRRHSVFFPLTALLIYLGIGPWCVGEIVSGVYGLIWVHGVQVAGHFIPGSLTYLFGSFQILFWYIPLTFYLNHLLSPSSSSSSPSPSCCGCCSSLLCHSLMLLCLVYHWRWYYTFVPYGPLALIVSPGVFWTIPISCYLTYSSIRSHSRTMRMS